MSRHDSANSRGRRQVKRYLTPTWSTIGMGIVSAAFYLLMTAISQNILFGYAAKTYAVADNLTGDNGDNVTILGIGAVAVVGIGALLLGFVRLAVQWALSSDFSRGLTLPRRQHGDLLMYGDLPVGIEPIALPDSREATVIAPDLSNLPPGGVAIDPATGQRFEKPPEDEGADDSGADADAE